MRLLPILRLLRVGTLFSPAADVVASAAIAGVPWDALVARAAGASVCLYAAGMVWNDVADRRIDAVQRPERPLPRGDLPVAFAVGLGVLLIAAGLGLSPCRWHHAAIAVLVLAYDFGGKLVPWLGALAMGTLRALNLGTALALPLAIGAERERHVLVAAACYGVYIVAVTVLGIFEDSAPGATGRTHGLGAGSAAPKVRGRAVAAVQAAPPLVALAAITTVQGGPWPTPVLAAIPALWFLRRNARVRTWDQRTIRSGMTLLLLGTMLFTGLLALAAGEPIAAAAIVAAIVPARWISRRIALT